MKTLSDVAKAYKKAAGKAIYPGVPYSGYKTGTSKAFKTGNLLSKFVSSPLNAPNQIGRKTITGFELVLQIGPQGAEYGTYVHYGTSKMKSRPFASIGADDKEFNDVLDEFLEGQVDEMVLDELGAMDSQFRTAGFEIS